VRRTVAHLGWLIVALFFAFGLHGVPAAASPADHAGTAVIMAAASHDGSCDGCMHGKLACCESCNAGQGLLAEPVQIAAPPRPVDGIEATPMPRGLSLRPPLSPPREPV